MKKIFNWFSSQIEQYFENDYEDTLNIGENYFQLGIFKKYNNLNTKED